MPATTDKRTVFRELHESGFFILPNAWDAGSAARLAALGFPAIASTSMGAAWAAGKNDGELSLEEVLDHLRKLVAATDAPVNADFENAFAHDPRDVAVNIRKAVATGVAGVSLEDWSGTSLYDFHLAVERVAAARSAIDSSDPRVMLIGRSEHFRVPGMKVSASIERAAAYAAAGADCLFVPMIGDRGALRELVAAVAPKPVSVLLPSLEDYLASFAEVGVRRCSTGTLLASVAWAGFEVAARSLRGQTPVAISRPR